MNSKFLRYAIALFAFATLFQSCKKDDNGTTLKEYTNGVFITNEGAFSGGTGSVSFWSRDNQVRVNNIYQNANGIPLGNIVNSITLHSGNAYIVVNNAGKVEVADAKTLAQKGSIGNLQYPRYFVGVGNKGYITEFVDVFSSAPGRISVVDLTTLQVITTIPLGLGPDRMELVGDKLYVVNTNDSTVSVINTVSDVVENTIVVGPKPNSLKIDNAGNMWVVCGGSTWVAPKISPCLARFELANPSNLTQLSFNDTVNTASALVSNATNDKLYYLYNSGVYTINSATTTLPASPIINRSFYNIAVDPLTGDLYGADALDYSSVGKVLRYNASYQATDSLSTDIIPGNFFFVN